MLTRVPRDAKELAYINTTEDYLLLHTLSSATVTQAAQHIMTLSCAMDRMKTRCSNRIVSIASLRLFPASLIARLPSQAHCLAKALFLAPIFSPSGLQLTLAMFSPYHSHRPTPCAEKPILSRSTVHSDEQ